MRHILCGQQIGRSRAGTMIYVLRDFSYRFWGVELTYLRDLKSKDGLPTY